VIENETEENIFASPDEICGFYTALERKGKVFFMYDVQNLWQMGCFPTLDVYDQLKDITACLHLKGGEQGKDGQRLKWASALEDASWPVADILTSALAAGVKTICLNQSHGEGKPGYDYSDVLARDVSFANRVIQEIEQ
jgi:hypothetical protein